MTRADLGAAFMVMVITAIAFARTLGFDFVDYDDTANLHDHESWRGLDSDHLRWMFTSYHMGHYHPLTWVSWALDWQLAGHRLDAFYFHLQNVIWHALNAGLCYLLLVRLLRRCTEPGSNDALASDALGNDAISSDAISSDARNTSGCKTRLMLGAAAGALFFAIHPLRVESVAWITERRDVLSGCFFLLTLLAYLRAQDSRRLLWLGIALVCTTLSLLSKAWAVTLPLVLLVLDVWPLRRRLDDWRVWAEKLPFFALGAFFAGKAVAAQAQSGALQALADFSLLDRIGQSLFGLVLYPWLTLFPLGLVPSYEMPADTRVIYTRYALGITFTVALIVGLLLLRRRAPFALAAWLAYAIIVAPVLGLLQSGPQIAADRYTYLACLPFAALFALGVQRLTWLRRLAWPWLLALLVITFNQSGFWRDTETLWGRTVARAPEHFRANQELGQLRLAELPRFASKDQLERVAQHFRAALAARPYDPSCLNNLGIVLSYMNRERDAIPLWQKAFEMWPNDPYGQLARQNYEETKKRFPELFR